MNLWPPGYMIDGRYRIIYFLGKGGSAVVYRVADERNNREFALKILKEASKQHLLRFQREFRLLRLLRHPNIVRVHDYGVWTGRPYFVMDLIEGREIHHRFRALRGGRQTRIQPFPVQLFIDCALQITMALEHSHAAGVIHRDLKPENILVTQTNRVILMDFGLARPVILPRATRLTQGALGTLLYMAPEQLSNLAVDARSDLFALGSIFYEMCVGTPPFFSADRKQIITNILSEPVKPLRRLDPSVPEQIEQIVLRLLDKDASKRFQNASKLRQALLDTRYELIGNTGPLPVSSLIAPVLHAPPLLGRDDIMDELRAAMKDCFDGLPTLIMIQGTKGSGKTRIYTELAAMWSGDALTLIEGRFTEDAAQPYGAFREILPTLSLIYGDSDAANDSSVSNDGRGRIRLIEQLFRRDAHRSISSQSRREPDTAAKLIAQNLHTLLVRSNRDMAVALILDDIHFADNLSLDVILRLGMGWLKHRGIQCARSSRKLRLALICTFDPSSRNADRVRSILSGLFDAAECHKIELVPLSRDACANMVQAILGKPLRERELIDLFRLSGGNPLLLQITLKSWLDGSALQLRDGQYQLVLDPVPPIDARTAPVADLATIAERYFQRQLPDSQLRLLAAAILAPKFTISSLAKLIATPVPDIMEEAGHWTDRGLVLLGWDNDLQEDACWFSHEVISRSILNKADAGTIRSLHRKVAELAARGEFRDSRPLPLVRAIHLLAAGDLLPAFHAFCEAGDHAASHSRFERASAHYRSALQILDTQILVNDPARTGDRAGLCLKLGDMLNRTGRYSDAKALLSQCLTAAQMNGELSTIAALQILLHVPAVHAGQFQEAEERLVNALTLVRKLGDKRKEAETQLLLGQTAFDCDNYPQAQQHFQLAMGLSDAVGDEELTAEARFSLGQAHYISSDFPQALRLFKEAATSFRNLNRLDQLYRSQNAIAVIYTFSGKLRQAAAVLRPLVRGLRAMGAASDFANSAGNLAVISFVLGRPSDSQRLLAQAQDKYADSNDLGGMAQIDLNLAFTALHTGQWRRAETHLANARKNFSAIGRTVGLADCDLNEARLRLRQGRYRDAIAAALSCVRRNRRANGRDRDAAALVIRAQCLAPLGRRDDAVSLSRKMRREAERNADRLTALEASVVHGLRLLSTDKVSEGIQVLNNTASAAKVAGNTIVQATALVHLAYAWGLAQDTEMAVDSLAQGRRLAETGGFVPILDRAQFVADALAVLTDPTSLPEADVLSHLAIAEAHEYGDIIWRYHLLLAQMTRAADDSARQAVHLAHAQHCLDSLNSVEAPALSNPVDINWPLL